MADETKRLTAYLKGVDTNPDLKIDFKDVDEVQKLKDMDAIVTKSETASAGIYIKGSPQLVADTLKGLCGHEYERLSATLSLRGDKK